MKKVILKLTSDTLQKLAIVGIALGIFQNKTDGIWWALAFLVVSYILAIWEANERVDSLYNYWNSFKLRGNIGKIPAQRLNKP